MIYDIFRVIGLIVGYPLQFLFFKRRTFYEDKKSTDLRRGGKLIITNHYNMLDYVLTSFIVCPRKLCAVASEEPFKSPITRFGMRFFGAIQANRETRSMGFMDECARVIRNGQLVQIFPEGQNTPDGEIHEFKKSYLVIAYRADSRIVPIVSDGNYGVFKRVSVLIGKEIDLTEFFEPGRRTPTREELARANEYVYSKMLSLKKELEVRKQKTARRSK